jgi:hypothetical protein
MVIRHTWTQAITNDFTYWPLTADTVKHRYMASCVSFAVLFKYIVSTEQSFSFGLNYGYVLLN